MPFVSEDQRKWMHVNKPEMAERWEEHTPKGKKLPKKVKKAAFEPLQAVGAGVTNILGKFTPTQWSNKINKLRTRAQLGDSKAAELLSIIGVASIVLGSGLGMYAGSKLGKGSGLFGSALGGLVGASPALMSGETAPAPVVPVKPPKPPAPFDPTPWQKSELL